ncbi:MAG: toll/interleukin-1 receptor domain-containing protein [Altibacter sp.]|nr:toll/interleukin-1 receptor domain-containing protein [Altibacter sp.]
MSKNKIFISYSRADTEYVSKLVTDLRSMDFEVWFDKNIRSGEEWDNVIEREIKNADAMILVLSATSVASNNVKDEMSYALELDKHVSPIKIEPCAVPMRLARKQHIDFTETTYEKGLTRLVEDLNYALKTSASAAHIKGSPAVTAVSKKVPPKTSGSGKKIGYIVGGILGFLLLLWVFGFFDGDTATADTSVETQQEEVTEEGEALSEEHQLDWDNTVLSRRIPAYVEYIRNYGNEDPYYVDAQKAIDQLMNKQGNVTYSDPEGTVYFEKLVYSTPTSDFEIEAGDMAAPQGGDLLVALTDAQVYGKQSGQFIEGEVIYQDQVVRVLEVVPTTDGYIFLYVSYSD